MDTSFWPIWSVRLRTPRLELRPVREREALELIELAGRGVHDPATMPFIIPWTDAPSPERERASLRHYMSCWAELTPQSWRVPFAVLADGECVGSQSMLADDFALLRKLETGSWLGREFQGLGYGKEMRSAALHFAFEVLGARSAVSGAFEDNAASLGVTRSLGYRPNGDDVRRRRDSAARELRFVMDRDDWSISAARDVPVTIEGASGDLLDQLGAPPL